MMSLASRKEWAVSASHRYKGASKPEKTRILDQFVADTGYNRKYALQLLGRGPAPPRAIRRRRPGLYGLAVQRALERLWRLSGHLGSRRLVPFLPEFIQALERHAEIRLDPEVKDKLARISVSTADRLLAQARKAHGRRGRSATKPGTLLKKQIAFRMGTEWDDAAPGFMEADLVAHNGSCAAGEHAYTLCMTDVALGWTEIAALSGKGQAETLRAIAQIAARLPFPLKGIDSDNGSEFVNHHLKRFCEERALVFTRCRPYHKNDQCRVEQKNWSVVRRHVGYGRFDGPQDLARLRELYGVLRLLVNFFEPSVRIERKTRVDGRTLRTYAPAATPFRRLLASGILSEHEAGALQEHYMQLNPAALRRRLRALKADLLQLHTVRFSHEATNGS